MGQNRGTRASGPVVVLLLNHHLSPLAATLAMLLLSMSTLAGAMVIITLAAFLRPEPAHPLEEDRCGYAFCEVCNNEAPFACSACKTTRYCS